MNPVSFPGLTTPNFSAFEYRAGYAVIEPPVKSGFGKVRMVRFRTAVIGLVFDNLELLH